MRIAIYSRGLESEQLEGLKVLLSEFSHYDIEPVIFQDFFNLFYTSINIQNKYSTFNRSDNLDEIDFLISLGGDGTLLDAVTFVGDKGIPILGINYGRLGFLASIGKHEIHSALEALVKRTFMLDKRTLVHLDANLPIFKGMSYALNEFTLHKKDVSPMIKIHTYLNGEFLNTYWADGLIVATPTGSTGYSLSCNGPVVFPDDSVISFEVEGRTDGFLCTLDSRREIAVKEALLAIRKEVFTIQLVRLNENNFLQTIRNKLSWGLDKR